MQIKTKLTLCLSVLALLTACKVDKEVDHAIRKNTQIASAAMEKAKLPDKPYKVDTVSTKNDIWLGQNSIKISDGDPLPARFEHDNGITLVATKPANLVEIAEQISVLTGIPIRIDDLVLDKIKSADSAADVETQGDIDQKDIAANIEENNNPFKYMMILSHSGKLSTLLDQIAIRFSLWWRYKDGTVTFYEMENRIYTIYALPSNSSMNAQLTSGGNASQGDSQATSSIGLQATADIELWGQIEAAIKGLVPTEANFAISRSTGTISVTAPPFTLKRVGKYVKDLNLRLSRQVAIGVKVLRVTMKESDTYEFNLSAAFKDSNVDIAFKNLAGSSIDYPTLSFGVVDGRWSGNALMKALSEQNDTSVITSASVTTMNNKAAPVQVAQTISYIANIEKETEGTGEDKTITYSTTVEKVSNGFTMEVLPRILDHGRLIVLFSLSMTQVEEDSLVLQSIDLGDGAVSLSLPRVHTRSFIQEVAMTSGNTLVLSGFEGVENATDRGGLGDPKFTALGGKANSLRSREMIVVLLTPEVLATPLSPEARMNDI